MKSLIIHTDGGSRGNPGPAACAFVFLDSDQNVLDQASLYLGIATNNEAEYRGVILALEHLLQHQPQYSSFTTINFTLDSELVVKQLLGQYKIKKPELQTLATNIRQLLHQLPQKITFTHVRRHLNHLPDTLLNQELDRHH